MNYGQTAFKLGFEISPILLTRGIAQLVPGGVLPIVALTEGISLTLGILNLNPSLDLDDFFAHWIPLPGASLIHNQIGSYPFANQVVAANAIIKEPLNISMLMLCPVNQPGGYTARLATLSAMKATLDYHHQNGGTYTVMTPSFFYTDCVLLNVEDVTSGESKQAQTQWRFDFSQPLVSTQDALALGNVMSSIDGGLPITGNLSWSNVGNSIASAL
jgi:hypothetical protein